MPDLAILATILRYYQILYFVFIGDAKYVYPNGTTCFDLFNDYNITEHGYYKFYEGVKYCSFYGTLHLYYTNHRKHVPFFHAFVGYFINGMGA